MIWQSRHTALRHLNLLLGEHKVKRLMSTRVFERNQVKNIAENESSEVKDILAKHGLVGPDRKLAMARLVNTMYKMSSDLAGEKLSKKKLTDMGALGIGLDPNLSWPGMQLLLHTTSPWLKAERMKNVNRDASPTAAATLCEHFFVKSYRHLLMDDIVHRFRNRLFQATLENESMTMLIQGRQRVWNWVDGLFEWSSKVVIFRELKKLKAAIQTQQQQQQQQQKKKKKKQDGEGAEGSKKMATTSKKAGMKKKQVASETNLSEGIEDADVEDLGDDEVEIIEPPAVDLQLLATRRQEAEEDRKTIESLITRIERSLLVKYSYIDDSNGPIVKEIYKTLNYLGEVSGPCPYVLQWVIGTHTHTYVPIYL